jgi:hypothetical protein
LGDFDGTKFRQDFNKPPRLISILGSISDSCESGSVRGQPAWEETRCSWGDLKKCA